MEGTECKCQRDSEEKDSTADEGLGRPAGGEISGEHEWKSKTYTGRGESILSRDGGSNMQGQEFRKPVHFVLPNDPFCVRR